MRVLNRTADRFQHALEGGQVTDEAISSLLDTSRRMSALGTRGSGPDRDFVDSLRQRLVAEAASMPAPSPAAARASAARRADRRTAPVVVVVGRGLPRAIAGAAASALLVGGIVGVASRGAVPGDSLYPVKSWLDSVAVRLASSDLDRGLTFLQQAQEHISDARDLTDQRATSGEVNVALDAAIDSVRSGQRSLDAAYANTDDPQALVAMRDFTARALPQVDALRTEVPLRSRTRVGELEALLRDSRQTTARRVVACGAPCNSLLSAPPAAVPLTSSARASTAPVPSPTSVGPAVTVPSTALTNAPDGGGGTSPAAGASSGGLGVGRSRGGTGVSTGGASVSGPTISASVPLVPGATATVPLPSTTLSSGTLKATVPSSTLGPITLPGATITLP